MVTNREVLRDETIAQNTGQHRKLNKFWTSLVIIYTALAILLSINIIFDIRIFGYMPLGNAYYYEIMALFLPLVFVIYPATKSSLRNHVPWYDSFLLVLSFVAALYFAANAFNIINQGWELGTGPAIATAFSIALWLLIIEAARRTQGWALASICLAFSLYPLIANKMPGILNGFSFDFFGTALYHITSLESVISIPMRTLADLIIGYMVFGIVLQHTGAGKFFVNLTLALLGHVRGGPAKVSVVSSALFGTLTGSAISNIISTGSVTIPLMKSVGYPAHFAAAVEAVSSTGGPLMPPVMGAVAFIMASFLAVPYGTVVAAAVLPAILYYLAIFLQVDGRAAKLNMVGLPRSQCPSLKETLAQGWTYIFSFVLLIFLLIYMRMEAEAPFYASAMLIATAIIRKHDRLKLKGFLEIITSSGKFLSDLTAILAAVGLIVGTLTMTGIASSFTTELKMLAGNNLILLLALTALGSAILGMGMTVSACYIFLAIIMAPALINSGINPIAAHLFILYWGLVSFLTPPVALSSITAANLAQCSSTKTSFTALRLGVTLFFVPFFFVLNPSLILIGSPLDITISAVTAIIGVVFLAYGLEGVFPWLLGKLNLVARFVMILCGVMLIYPEIRVSLIAVAILGIFFAYYLVRKRLTGQKYFVG